MTQEERECMHVGLIHNHIPKIVEADIIEWDADDKTVDYRGDPVLDAFLDVAEEFEKR